MSQVTKVGFILESGSRLIPKLPNTVSRAPGLSSWTKRSYALAELHNHWTSMCRVSTVCFMPIKMVGIELWASPPHPLTSGMWSGGNEPEAPTYTGRVLGWGSTRGVKPKASPGHQTVSKQAHPGGAMDWSSQQKKGRPWNQWRWWKGLPLHGKLHQGKAGLGFIYFYNIFGAKHKTWHVFWKLIQ